MSYDNYNTSYRRRRLVGPAQLVASADIWHPTSTQKYALGCQLDLNDGTGRKFRYCKDNGSGITRARMASGPAPAAGLTAQAQTAYGVSAGSKTFNILVTTGNGVTNGSLVNGLVWVNASPTDGSTIGDCYLIKNNTWTTSDTVLNLEIADRGGIRQAISATDELTVHPSPFSATKVITANSLDAMPVGVPLVDVTASYYYWAQYRGLCPLIIDASDTVVVGAPVGMPGTSGTNGAGGVIGDDGTDATWGTVVVVNDGADVGLVNLMLP